LPILYAIPFPTSDLLHPTSNIEVGSRRYAKKLFAQNKLYTN